MRALGTGAYKVSGARPCSSTRKEVSMATPQVAPPRHSHTELFSGILTNQYLPGPELKREGGLGKNTAPKWQASNKNLVKTLCEEV